MTLPPLGRTRLFRFGARTASALAACALVALTGCTVGAPDASTPPGASAEEADDGTVVPPDEQGPNGEPIETVQAYLTAYTYFDNTPPGSAVTSNPVLHFRADGRTGEAGGVGTYEDPITLAVGHVIEDRVDTLDFAAGTRFYVPNLRRYFIVEDTCGDGDRPQDGPCHEVEQSGQRHGATIQLDLWIGGEDGSEDGADDCAKELTGTFTVVMAPADGYAVVSGPVYSGDGCSRQYGDDIVVPGN